MSIAEELKQLFTNRGLDDRQLIEGIETLAMKRGQSVYQEVFRQLLRRGITPARAERYWQEGLIRWQSRSGEQGGIQTLKAVLFDYLQSLVGDHLGSVHDGMTGLYTADYLFSHLEQLIAAKRSKTRATAIGLLQLRPDQLHELNEHHNHFDADKAMRQLGKLITQHIRPMDTAAWNDKGQFTILLPEASKPQTFTIAERIRNAVNDHDFPGQWALPGHNLTISVGMAAYPQDAMLPRRLLLAAEEQMHLALAQGDCCYPVATERRRTERATVHSMVEIASTDAEVTRQAAMALDISARGIGLGCDAPIRQGNLVTLNFKRPYWPVDREVTGRVCRVHTEEGNQLPHIGLEFLNAEPDLLQPFSGIAI